MLIFKVELNVGTATLEYYCRASNALEAIDIVADSIEGREYTWCDSWSIDDKHAYKTMDVGAGAYPMRAFPISLVN